MNSISLINLLCLTLFCYVVNLYIYVCMYVYIHIHQEIIIAPVRNVLQVVLHYLQINTFYVHLQRKENSCAITTMYAIKKLSHVLFT